MDSEQIDNKFHATHKRISLVNSLGKMTKHEIFLWNEETQNWQQFSKTGNQYRNDTILIGVETLEWENKQEVKQERVVYDQDTLGNRLANYTTYKEVNSKWIPANRFEEVGIPIEQKK